MAESGYVADATVRSDVTAAPGGSPAAPSTVFGPGGVGRRVVAVAGLLLIYVAIVTFGDTRAYSGSDAGGKVATVRVMAEHHTLRPDLGYWAEKADPAGRFFPIVNTGKIGDQWVQATSLPFEIVAYPLWRGLGAPGVLLIPMLGSLLAAVAARRISRRLGAGDGWLAFWLVGACGPAMFYAGDFWEHAPALGLALLSIDLALAAKSARAALAAGVCAGLAVVFRLEMALFAAAFAVASVAIGQERRRWWAHKLWIVVGAVGAAVVLAANQLLERHLLGATLRGARATNEASNAGARLSGRGRDAVVTSLGVFADQHAAALIVAAVTGAVALLVMRAVVVDRRPATPLVRAGVYVLLAVLAGRVVVGPGFIPGGLVASPLAFLGLVSANTPLKRALVITALVGLPAVWLFEVPGLHVAAWGGRYSLLASALLTIVGATTLHAYGLDKPAARMLVAAAVIVGLLGAAWHAERTVDVGKTFDALNAAPSDVVLVSTDENLLREGGAWYGDHRALTIAEGGSKLTGDLDSLPAQFGVTTFDVIAVVDNGKATPLFPQLSCCTAAAPRRISYVPGSHLEVVRYAAS